MRSLWILALASLAGACGPLMEGQVKRVDNLRLQDAVSGYETARKGGDLLDMCVKAKLVRIAYADARDTGNSAAWTAREAEDCRLAMVALGAVRPPAP
ncbi:hypothetical protein [Phenylobacterium sp.]|uniref:hypothetical protein n=1 Tax=Phenylobacterium sp. TaxID=1871053 RepID=UPI00398391E6